MTSRPVVVAGAGPAGLAAAWELSRTGVDVVVHEAADRIGGKLQASAVPGLALPLDEGADAFLARVPDALELCAEVGIDDLVHPAARSAWVHVGDGLRPLPAGQLLGVPTDLDELAASGLVSPEGVARARRDLDADAPPLTEDVSVGALVRERLGDEVCDHLVEPLLGGINGGEADGLSLRAAGAQIWACAQRGGSLIRAAAAMKAQGDPTAPVFAAPAAGMAALPRSLADRLAEHGPGLGRVEVRLASPLPPVAPDPATGGLLVGGDPAAGLVLAVPADVAGAAVRDLAPDAAAALAAWDFASVVMVTVVARRDTVDHALDGSGFVVARTAGRSITAASWGSSKWAHWDDGEHVVLRVSLGHDGDPTDWVAASDDDLVTATLADLRAIMGVDVVPVGTRVGRWTRAFPQYRPGHVERVAGVRAALADAGPVALAGMSLDGIGVPASLRSGRVAARSLLGT